MYKKAKEVIKKCLSSRPSPFNRSLLPNYDAICFSMDIFELNISELRVQMEFPLNWDATASDNPSSKNHL